MDGFILDATIDQNVKPKDYGFSSELKKITKTTKEIETKNDANMSSLIKAIRGNLEIEAIQSTLVYLKENTYSSKESDLRKLFANAIAFSQNKVLGEVNIRTRRSQDMVGLCQVFSTEDIFYTRGD